MAPVIASFSIPDAGSAERPRVPLADDHSAVLALTTDVLSGECFVVGSVGDGCELLAEAERLHPDVIVLDITMLDLDGIEAARQLKRAGCRAKLVFLTVHEDLTSDLITAIHEALVKHRSALANNFFWKKTYKTKV